MLAPKAIAVERPGSVCLLDTVKFVLVLKRNSFDRLRGRACGSTSLNWPRGEGRKPHLADLRTVVSVLLAFSRLLMKTSKNGWFGKSDVGIYSEMRVSRFGRGGPRGATEASDGFEH